MLVISIQYLLPPQTTNAMIYKQRHYILMYKYVLPSIYDKVVYISIRLARTGGVGGDKLKNKQTKRWQRQNTYKLQRNISDTFISNSESRTDKYIL